MVEKSINFGFGKNWKKFIEKHFNDERVELSKKHLLEFLQMKDLEGKYFLDVGCGSGLHSLAAFKSGAERIISFDLDINSVNTTKKLKEYAGSPSHWKIEQGSVLDRKFLKTIEPADVVYSWGVLHHTGNVWEAIQNTVELMHQNSIFYLALYSGEPPYFGKPGKFWIDVKKRYNQSSWMGKKKLEIWYFWEFFLQKNLRKLPDLINQAQDYKSRGMEIYTDAKDWLGGWPMEFVPIEKLKKYCREVLNLKLINLNTEQANAEYLLQKK